MLFCDEMPDDKVKLADIPVTFPEVPLDRIALLDSCVAEIIEYFEIDDYSPDDGVHFIRTTDVDGTSYYIWNFTSGGDDCFATVSIKHRAQCTGCNENRWGLTHEQFIMVDYHQCL